MKNKKKKRKQLEVDPLVSSETIVLPDDNDNIEKSDDDHDEYIPSIEKSKCVYNRCVSNKDDDLPEKYRHIRLGPHSVRPEIYMTIHQLMSEYHMSKRQAFGAVCTVANNVFGRKEYGEWKPFIDKVPTDPNTLPAPQNINRTEAYVEALVLSGIAHDIMSSEDETVVTYSNDGSSQSGVGGYIVQSFSIDGKQRVLPTLHIFSESRATLKELELMNFQMLSAAKGCKFSEKDLVEKIDFAITDSTSHNLGVC